MALVEDRVTDPQPPRPRRANPVVALLRNSWRQLTSMRTALVLLFLLAVAAIPGSVLPQRGVNPEDVNDFFREYPEWGPVLDRIGAFEVFSSVWFSAIYLLLFISLIGCIVPRLRDHVRALRAPLPAAPKRLERLPQHAELVAGTDAAAIAAVLRKRRWRVAVRGDEVSAEKGYLKETGNLLFHFSLIAVLIGVALGSWYGWQGNRLLVAGEENSYCNTRQQYVEADIGPQVDDAGLPKFCLTLDDFEARFLPTGMPEQYTATVTVVEGDAAPRTEKFSVNSPLRLHDANVHLLGHGYAPVLRYTDRYGRSQTSDDAFLAQDGNLTSEGVAVFPDANFDPDTGKRDEALQIAFEGIYMPTAPEDADIAVSSQFPEQNNPAIFLIAYQGNLGLDSGIPGSVYSIDQTQVQAGRLTQIGNGKLLAPGETWTLDDGTTLEFLGTRPYITISARHDPGTTLLLVSSATLLIGLMGSLFGKRRRIWFRLAPAQGPTTGGEAASAATTTGSRLIAAGGLPRTDYPGFADEFAEIIAAIGGERSAETGTDRAPAAETGKNAATDEATTEHATKDDSAGAARRAGAPEGTT